MPQHSRLLSAPLLLLLLVAPVSSVQANSIWTEDCNLSPKSNFGYNEAVCAQGDVDSPCNGSIIGAADIWIIPAGAPNFALAPGSLPSRIVTAGGAGGFWGEYIWLPPLVPGTYDLLMDEACDGNWDSDDLRVNNAFTVMNVDTGVVVDVAGIKADALAQASQWGQIRANWDLMAAVVSLIGKINNFAGALAGDFSGLIGWIYGKATGMPTDYNGAVLQIGTRIIHGLTTNMEIHFLLLAADPPDANYEELVTLDWSVLEGGLDPDDPGYPYSPLGDSELEERTLAVASVLAEQAVLGDAFIRSFEKYQGADEVVDNYYIHLTAGRASEFAGAMVDNFDTITAELIGYRDELEGEAGAALTHDPAEFALIQQRLADEGLDEDETELLQLYGLDENGIQDFVDATIAQELPTGSPSYLSTVQAMIDGVDEIRESYAEIVTQLDAVVGANAPFVVATHPEADAGGSYAGSVGEALTLWASGSTSPAGEALSYAWDLDTDGDFDDATGASPSWTPEAEGRQLVGVLVTDTSGRTAAAWAAVEVEASDLAPVIEGFEPAGLLVEIVVDNEATFSVEASDPEGSVLSYSWSIDDVEVGTDPSFAWTPGPQDLGLHVVAVTVDDGGTWSRTMSEQRQVRVLGEDEGDDDDDTGDDDDGAGDDDDESARGGTRPSGGCACDSAQRGGTAPVLALAVFLGLLGRRPRRGCRGELEREAGPQRG